MTRSQDLQKTIESLSTMNAQLEGGANPEAMLDQAVMELRAFSPVLAAELIRKYRSMGGNLARLSPGVRLHVLLGTASMVMTLALEEARTATEEDAR